MAAYRDLMSVVDDLNGYQTRILEPDGDSLTSIQKQVRRDELARAIKTSGISFNVDHDTDHYSTDYSKVFFKWATPVDVKGTGTITDVRDVGDYPIHLSLGEQVSVRFEPRNLGDWDGRHKVSNLKFADLKKGSVYDFQGMISYADYYFKQGPKGRFEFRVEAGGLVGRFFKGLFG
jgi:hypothetical protein